MQHSAPPYEGSQSAYNGNGFDYNAYWARAKTLDEKVDVILFDSEANIKSRGYEVCDNREMRISGARPGYAEAVSFTC